MNQLILPSFFVSIFTWFQRTLFRQGEHAKIFEAKLRHFNRLNIIELLTIAIETLNLRQIWNTNFCYIRCNKILNHDKILDYSNICGFYVVIYLCTRFNSDSKNYC